jgi:hypothetical protein
VRPTLTFLLDGLGVGVLSVCFLPANRLIRAVWQIFLAQKAPTLLASTLSLQALCQETHETHEPPQSKWHWSGGGRIGEQAL